MGRLVVADIGGETGEATAQRVGRDVRRQANIFAIADDWRLAGSALANSQIANPRLTLWDRQRIGRPSMFRVLRSGGLSAISRSYGLR
jgi:hypothetical protein